MLFKNLEQKGNPWGQSAKERTTWIDEVEFDVPVYGEDVESFEGFEYLFWVGCAGAFEDRAKKTTKAVAELLATAGVKFLVLGTGETCTGDSARRAGNEFLFQQLAAQNKETIDGVFEGVETVDRKIVVTCPHCFNTLGREYTQLGTNYTVLHHTQLLNRLVRDKKLVPVSPVSQDITYHDPCYLGRHNKEYAAPRELIGASGATLTEMPRHADRGLCCGAGGARMWMEEHIGKRVNHERVEEALETGASKIATGCPFCRVMMTDGVDDRAEAMGKEKAEVLDVAQLLLGSLDKSTVTLPAKGAAAEAAAARAAAAPAKVEKEAPAEEARGREEQNGSKPPQQDAPAAKTETPAVPAKGLGIQAKRPPKKGAAASAPAAPAAEAPAAEAPAVPVKGLGIAAKRPPKKGAQASVAPAAEAPAAATPAVPVKGLAIAAKRPPKKGAQASAAPTAPAAPAAEAPAASAESEAPAAETASEAPKVEVKGLAIQAKRPPKKGAQASAPASAPAAPATPEPEPEPAAAQPEPEQASSNGQSAEPDEPAAPSVEVKGLGIAPGVRRPPKR